MYLPLHERLQPSVAMRAVTSALAPFAVTNRRHMFVYRDVDLASGNTYYLKLRSYDESKDNGIFSAAAAAAASSSPSIFGRGDMGGGVGTGGGEGGSKGSKGANISKPISKGFKRPPRHPAAVGVTSVATSSSSASHHVVEAGAGATSSSSSEYRGSNSGLNGFTSRAGWWDDVNIETDRASSSSGLPRHGLHESHESQRGHGGHGSPHEGRGVGSTGSKGRGGGGIGNSKSSSRSSRRSVAGSSIRSTNKGLVLEVYGIERCPISAEVTEDLRGHLETKLSSMTLAKLRSLLGTSFLYIYIGLYILPSSFLFSYWVRR